MTFLHGFVNDDKTRGGSAFLEEVAGKKHQRKVPVNKSSVFRGRWFLASWAETFPCDFAIVLDYRDADQGFLGTLSCNGSCVTCVMSGSRHCTLLGLVLNGSIAESL